MNKRIMIFALMTAGNSYAFESEIEKVGKDVTETGQTLEKLSSPARRGILLPAAQQAIDQVKEEAARASATISQKFDTTVRAIDESTLHAQQDASAIRTADIDAASKKRFEDRTQSLLALYQQQRDAELKLAQAEDAYQEYDALASQMVNLSKTNTLAAQQIRRALTTDPISHVNTLIENVEKAANERNVVVKRIADQEQQLATMKRDLGAPKVVAEEAKVKPTMSEEEKSRIEEVKLRLQDINAINAKVDEVVMELDAMSERLSAKGDVKITADQIRFNTVFKDGEKRIAAIQQKLKALAERTEKGEDVHTIIAATIDDLGINMRSFKQDLQAVIDKAALNEKNILQRAFIALKKLIDELIELIKEKKYNFEVSRGGGTTPIKKIKKQYPEDFKMMEKMN